MQGRRILLHFGAVDYETAVYVNGDRVGGHTGGYTPFTFDITPYLKDGENDLCLRVEDWPDVTQPRGKQYWDRGVMGCWYTPVSGIWQTVYMEAVGDVALKQIHVTPDIDRGVAGVEIADEGTGFDHDAAGFMAEDHIGAFAEGAFPDGVNVRSAWGDGEGADDGVQRSAGGAGFFDPSGASDAEHSETFHFRSSSAGLVEVDSGG